MFYQELGLEWQAYRQWRPGLRQTLTLGLDGAARWSHTDSFGLLPDGWNNRVEQAVVASFDQALGRGWRLQLALRLQGARYLHRDRARSDFHRSFRLSLIRPLGPAAELRIGLGYDRRSSSEAAIADFAKWDLGIAGSARWRF